MHILGVNTGPHDASAALVRDGELVSMVEQERLSRNKRAPGEWPDAAIRHCLAGESLSLEDVAVVAVGWDMAAYRHNEELPFDIRAFRDGLGLPVGDRPPLIFYRHHLAHAASAYYVSGFDCAMIVVADGRGEDVATSTFIGQGQSIQPCETWDITQSLGNFYGLAAAWSGLDERDAGKFMGLAAYGRDRVPIPLRSTAEGYRFEGSPSPDSRRTQHYQQQRAWLRSCLFTRTFPYQHGDAAEIMLYADLAASVQAALQDAVEGIVGRLQARTACRHLVLAGGVAANCTLNGKLIDRHGLEDVFVPPFPHDAGVAVGAALLASMQFDPEWRPARRLDDACLSPAPGPAEAASAIRASGVASRWLQARQLASEVAELLAQGNVVGWWEGRAEVGQRALGARSILSDPRNRSMHLLVNTLKGREVWRPLAPSVLEEHERELFATPLPDIADFMLAACQVRNEARARIPAAVHVDGSSRPQRVKRQTAPRLWQLVDAFRDLTGCPAVLNTSFNRAGAPIVYTAEDALASARAMPLDAVVLDDHLVDLRQAGHEASRASRGARSTVDR